MPGRFFFSLTNAKYNGCGHQKLSGFVSGRFAPEQDWRTLWEKILQRLGAPEGIKLSFTPLVETAYPPEVKLPKRVEINTFKAAADWFAHSHLLVNSSEKESFYSSLATNGESMNPPRLDAPEGDGSFGILEGYASAILPDGTQPRRLPLRADCHAESAMVLALQATLDPRKLASASIAGNLLDFVYFNSGMWRAAACEPGSKKSSLWTHRLG